ncbi:O-antigen ligase family protein [Aquipseudomonas alcaligenes]|uniref:O-antigen ligase family protein n=1 Tax=Aquipseudomonas alcaligenes TaxID=43263 RepID=UPI00374A0C87
MSALSMLCRQSSIVHFITKRWLVLGYMVLLTGLFWLPSGSAYTKVFYALVALPALLGLALKPKRLSDLLREPLVLVVLAISAWLLASLAWSGTDNDLTGLAKRPLYLFLFIAACCLIVMESRELLLGTLRAAAVVATLAALVNLTLFLMEPPIDGRLTGVAALRNALLTSHVLGMFFTYWVAIWLSRDLARSWFPLLMAIPLLLALLATGSRTPLMALTLVSVWMLLMTPRRAAVLVATISLTAAISLIATPELLLQRGASFRPQIWAEALRQAQDHLWIGHGYDSTLVFNIEGLDYSLGDPHNIELAVLLELGLVGLILWLAMYGLGLLRCLRQRKDKGFQIASAMLIYGFSAGLTEGSSFLSRPNESWFLIWIPLTLVMALSIHQRSLERT